MNPKSRFFKVLKSVGQLPFVRDIEDKISSGERSISVKTLTGSLGAVIIAAISRKFDRPILYIAPNKETAENVCYDLSLFIDPSELALMTEPENSVHFDSGQSDDRMMWLVDGLSHFADGENIIAVATPDIFEIDLPGAAQIEEHKTVIETGQNLNFINFHQSLALNGFEKKEFVGVQGDMAVRGGILDIWPIGWENPLRVEFWGDEIESIREFNSMSQRSITQHESVEFIAAVLSSSQTETNSTIKDYLSDDYIFVIDSPDIIVSENNDFKFPDEGQTIFFNKLGDTDVQIQSHAQAQFNGSIKHFSEELVKLSASNLMTVLCAEGKIHSERFRDLVENRMEEIINPEYFEILSRETSDFTDTEAKRLSADFVWLDKAFSEGFVLPDYAISVYTEHQIFARRRRREDLRARKGKNSFSLQELKQLNIGDYVVHSDKGIGQFDGFETVLLGSNKQDCIKIIFADSDVLYVNLTYIHKVEKYASKEGVEPRLSKLGSAEWARKKSRAKKKLKDIARELIKLYAKRKMQKGHAFDLDGLWQKELEASFIYEDTPDQAKTTVDVKEDMEATTPMDRLVCGDVGFGKTEIAVRAAFKAVQSGKQTAILVPTTILAQQHFMTFKDRLSQYPVNVEVISRFRSKKEQTKILENVKAGITDILIGTHRILSKDVEFKDLGLLVIDEEQRFGVSAKEKLRQMRVSVDSLTLTATPIPRTLNFSMMGARDLSIISTPPRNRMPVETFVMQENEDKIVKAITSEVERKGQVYFVSNKVHDLEKITEKLRKLMPSVQFGIAHGQMRPAELEKVMEQFIKRNFDVLVCTKIIESGLDIPNANTIIINRANHFGLAELYQLRGRVGRTNTQAFCYLLIPPVSLLPPKTLRRLQAIEEFTDLGSGFRLAMRDLEIRGAGNLLGAEQSGYIDDMGFELYQKILEEAVAELRAEEFGELFKDRDDFKADFLKNTDIAIEIDSDAFIPADYIRSNTERFEFYSQLYNVPTNGELNIIREEMEDRFGKLPDEVLGLIFAVKLRIASLMTGFVKIGLRNNRLTAEFPAETNSEYYETAFPEITEFLNEIPGAKIYQHKKTLLLDIDVENRDEAVEVLWRIKQTAQFVVE